MMDQHNAFQQSYYKHISVAKETDSRTITDVLHAHYRNQPDREAVVFAHTDGTREPVTFRQLWKRAKILAKSFIRLGVKTSEFIAISMRTCPEWLYATFGAVLAGARPVSVSLTYTDGSDIIAMMAKLETCSALVLDPGATGENWNIISKLLVSHDNYGAVESDSMPYLRYLICHDKSDNNPNALTLKEMLTWENKNCVLPHLQADEIAVLLQTSGSTGVPKVVAHTHKSLISGSRYFLEAMSNRDCRIYNDRPFTWIGGFPVSLLTGETRVTRSRLCEPPEDTVAFLIDVARREKCDYMVLLPPMLHRLLERQEEIGAEWPIQQIGTGGQPITKRFAKCIGKLCKRFVCAYGSTEIVLGCSQTVSDPDTFLDYKIGLPNPEIEVKIIDDNGEITPTSQRGEICLKSDSVFKEYYNDPQKSRLSLSDDGWFHTEDIGFMLQDGTLFCEGRKSDDILSGTMVVAPAILEAVLEGFDGVLRVVCLPVPHEVLFQVICACVITKEGSDVTEGDLRNFCEAVHNDKSKLFTILPTYYMFMRKFPETSSGKISRKALTKLAEERFVLIN